MLLLFLHLEQEDMLDKETEKLLYNRSFGKNVYQQASHSKKILKGDIINGKSDADEPGKLELYLGTNCDISVHILEIQYLGE